MKKNTNQLLKNKLKNFATQLIQASKLLELEKEKEVLNDELSNCKDKILKFANEKKEWEKEKLLMTENLNVLKHKNDEMEK